VATPMTASSHARKVKGSKAATSESLIFLTKSRNSSSLTRGSRISGYKLANVGARSPLTIQSRFMRMILVVSYSSLLSGTWGFGWGKQGCEGPQGNSEASSPSPAVLWLLLLLSEVLALSGNEARPVRPDFWGLRPPSRSWTGGCCGGLEGAASGATAMEGPGVGEGER
jgi:hypothetical protein